MNRKEQQADLIFQLGLLLAPLQAVIDLPDRQDDQSRARACAKFGHDMDVFYNKVRDFAEGEPGHLYSIQARQTSDALFGLNSSLGYIVGDTTKLMEGLKLAKQVAIKGIMSIPTEMDAQIFEAHSPFTIYRAMRALCDTATTQLIWSDPYMGPSVFHRYLSDVPSNALITLITKARTGSEYMAFLDVSRLFAQDRGSTTYRLVTESAFHDRYLRCNDLLYHLGGSVKDAGKKSDFTVSKLDPKPDNFKKLDDLIAAGVEVFGPSNPNHP